MITYENNDDTPKEWRCLSCAKIVPLCSPGYLNFYRWGSFSVDSHITYICSSECVSLDLRCNRGLYYYDYYLPLIVPGEDIAVDDSLALAFATLCYEPSPFIKEHHAAEMSVSIL